MLCSPGYGLGIARISNCRIVQALSVRFSSWLNHAWQVMSRMKLVYPGCHDRHSLLSPRSQYQHRLADICVPLGVQSTELTEVQFILQTRIHGQRPIQARHGGASVLTMARTRSVARPAVTRHRGEKSDQAISPQSSLDTTLSFYTRY